MMTVRELIQQVLLESPNLDATVYIQKWIDEVEVKDYDLVKITNGGTNDAVFVEVKDWRAQR